MPRRRMPLRHLVVVGSFTMMLTALFYLAHDGTPYASRIIGWQALDSIVLEHDPLAAPHSVQHEDLGGGGGGKAAGAQAVPDELNLPSFPLDTYAPFLPNPAPLTDIAVESCLPFSACQPRTTPDDDARLGKWVRVDRSLDPTAVFGAASGGILGNLFGSIDQRFLFYRKSRRNDVPRVVEVRLVESGVDANPTGPGWHRVKNDLRSKYMRMWAKERNMHLYFRTAGGVDGGADGAAAHDEEAITELDLVYGDNPAWPGFSLAGVISAAHPAMGASRVSLSIRRTPRPSTGTLPPTFRRDGTFKVLQLADLHFSVNPEPCRDVERVEACVAKNDTLRLIGQWLDAEKPDLVVFSGDQLNGQATSWDERSVIPLFVNPLIERKVPWAAILGNHDSETGAYTRTEQMRLLQSLPYSLSRVGPAEVTGDGNYYIDLFSPHRDRTLLSTLWFFDSGSRAPKDKWKPWKKPGYGWVHADQVQWFRRKIDARRPTLRPYRPDGAEDLGPQPWRRRRSAAEAVGRRESGARGEWEADADQGQMLAAPPSILFMHIPVPEAFAPVDVEDAPPSSSTSSSSSSLGQRLPLIKGVREEITTFEGGQSQGGIFEAILDIHANQSSSTLERGSERGRGQGQGRQGGSIRLLCHGHMHVNEDCRRIDGVWICFAGGSSFAGYGLAGFRRRSRVVELSQWGDVVRTWHRVEGTPERVDELLLS
ncbi:uncharacterized protein PFL1_02437 [Pseudozyma flocculosa PF-1]|uniref:Related to DCR2 - dosage-dependent cell cycle regulator n=2 Tax=Pseudozyma flocculosa TaxID=84751 RepID=A0A5C3EYZ0_9BASI|nr:uncharacterized protein PFL1_02437 [Pseudozyma flocculosa PF-1]EPQ29764.1 hypothetical protein PFL1_02437 [Pseudozyma flocculosa PF-1]SPO37050.1 related to DCR2 - dosage-dependent cell cycle regulator [Pseudozyma flocculosa]